MFELSVSFSFFPYSLTLILLGAQFFFHMFVLLLASVQLILKLFIIFLQFFYLHIQSSHNFCQVELWVWMYWFKTLISLTSLCKNEILFASFFYLSMVWEEPDLLNLQLAHSHDHDLFFCGSCNSPFELVVHSHILSIDFHFLPFLLSTLLDLSENICFHSRFYMDFTILIRHLRTMTYHLYFRHMVMIIFWFCQRNFFNWNIFIFYRWRGRLWSCPCFSILLVPTMDTKYGWTLIFSDPSKG